MYTYVSNHLYLKPSVLSSYSSNEELDYAIRYIVSTIQSVNEDDTQIVDEIKKRIDDEAKHRIETWMTHAVVRNVIKKLLSSDRPNHHLIKGMLKTKTFSGKYEIMDDYVSLILKSAHECMKDGDTSEGCIYLRAISFVKYYALKALRSYLDKHYRIIYASGYTIYMYNDLSNPSNPPSPIFLLSSLYKFNNDLNIGDTALVGYDTFLSAMMIISAQHVFDIPDDVSAVSFKFRSTTFFCENKDEHYKFIQSGITPSEVFVF